MQVMIIGSGVFPAVARNIRSRYFDEVIMMMSIYSFLPYTPWVQDAKIKFMVGYVSSYLLVLHFAVHLGPITIETIKRVIRRIKLSCARRDQKRHQ